MKSLSIKQKVFFVVTIILTFVFAGFTIYAIVIGKYQQSIASSTSTMLMLISAINSLDIL